MYAEFTGLKPCPFCGSTMHFALSKKTASTLYAVTIRKAAAVRWLDLGKVSKKRKQCGIHAQNALSA